MPKSRSLSSRAKRTALKSTSAATNRKKHKKGPMQTVPFQVEDGDEIRMLEFDDEDSINNIEKVKIFKAIEKVKIYKAIDPKETDHIFGKKIDCSHPRPADKRRRNLCLYLSKDYSGSGAEKAKMVESVFTTFKNAGGRFRGRFIIDVGGKYFEIQDSFVKEKLQHQLRECRKKFLKLKAVFKPTGISPLDLQELVDKAVAYADKAMATSVSPKKLQLLVEETKGDDRRAEGSEISYEELQELFDNALVDAGVVPTAASSSSCYGGSQKPSSIAAKPSGVSHFHHHLHHRDHWKFGASPRASSLHGFGQCQSGSFDPLEPCLEQDTSSENSLVAKAPGVSNLHQNHQWNFGASPRAASLLGFVQEQRESFGPLKPFCLEQDGSLEKSAVVDSVGMVHWNDLNQSGSEGSDASTYAIDDNVDSFAQFIGDTLAEEADEESDEETIARLFDSEEVWSKGKETMADRYKLLSMKFDGDMIALGGAD